MRKLAIVVALGLGAGVLAASFLTCSAQDREAPKVRKSVIAGSWYPGNATQLRSMLNGFLTRARGSLGTKTLERIAKPVALVAPHAGYVYSGQTAAYAYCTLQGKSYRTVLLLGPGHFARFKGISIPSFTHYQTPLGKVEVERSICDKLLKKMPFTTHPRAHLREHSVEIELPFLQQVLGQDFKFVPMVVGELDDRGYAQAAEALKALVNDQTLVVVSSDFTHYGRNFGYLPFTKDIKENLRKLDEGAIQHILAKDRRGFLRYKQRTGATICGSRPIGILLALLKDRPDIKGDMLFYTTSGDITGNFSSSVSYTSIVFYKSEEAKSAPSNQEKKTSPQPPKPTSVNLELTAEEQKTLLRIARDTLRLYLKDRKVLDPKKGVYNITPALEQSRGIFVTLKRGGQLRGCIGYIIGMKPIHQAVVDNTVSAATRDPRFRPVTSGELSQLSIELSVMSPLQKIDDVKEVEVGKHGLYIIEGRNRGILLPQVATHQGWDRDQFLVGVCQKAGLPGDAWKKGARIYIFSAQVFSEKELHH